MSFSPRMTRPAADDINYVLYPSGYSRFGYLQVYPQGNCTGYAYGRMNECAGQSLYSDFYITQSPGHGKQWIYNSWPDQTFTSGDIDIRLGDVLVYGAPANKFGHVEVVEKISADRSTLTTSYSVYSVRINLSVTRNFLQGLKSPLSLLCLSITSVMRVNSLWKWSLVLTKRALLKECARICSAPSWRGNTKKCPD